MPERATFYCVATANSLSYGAYFCNVPTVSRWYVARGCYVLSKHGHEFARSEGILTKQTDAWTLLGSIYGYVAGGLDKKMLSVRCIYLTAVTICPTSGLLEARRAVKLELHVESYLSMMTS